MSNVFHAADWPHGLRCTRCSHPFFEGEAYSEVLEAFYHDNVVVSIVCVPCAIGGKP